MEVPCRTDGPDLWFLDKGDAPESVRRTAKDLCFTSCPIRLQCLDGALRRDERHGTWGGYFQEELRVIHRKARKRGITFT